MPRLTPTKPSSRFESARDEALFQSRLPAVESASMALQSAMGVSPPRQNGGNMSMEAWSFPLPASLAILAEAGEASLSFLRGGEDGEDEEMPDADADVFSTGVAVPSTPVASSASIAVGEFAEMNGSASLPSRHRVPSPELAVQILEATSPSHTAGNVASAGVLYTLARVDEEPVCWSPSLAQTLSSWLAHPSTTASLTPLSRATLRSTTPEDGEIAFDTGVSFGEGNVYVDDVEVLTVKIAEDAVGEGNRRPKEWVVVRVRCGEDKTIYEKGVAHDHHDDDGGYDGEDEGEKPWFVLAFPLEAVTASQIEAVDEVEGVFETVLTLGVAGKVPVMCEKGVDKTFVEEFMQACAEGKGEVVLESEGVWELNVGG